MGWIVYAAGMTKFSLLAFLALSTSSLALVAACGGATPAAQGPLKSPGEAKIGDRSSCPVSGEAFTITESSPKVEYEGKTYYFCCSGCAEKFKENPSKWSKKS